MTNAKRIFHTEEGIRISSSFGYRTSPINGEKEFHRGVDYATGGRKLPQYGLDNGVVIKAGKDTTGALFVEVEYSILGYIGQYYHLDSISVSKGQKVDENTIIGYTGTTGNSTGIHLHFGWYPIADKNVSYMKRRWSDFTKFKFEEKEATIMTIKKGFSKFLWRDQLIYFYKQNENEDVTLINSPYKDLRNIRDFVENEKYTQGLNVTCAINASYFIMSGTDRGQLLGRTQGINCDERPGRDTFLDLVITNENKLVSGNFESWEWLKPYAKVGLSYACCVLKDGKDVAEYSSAVGIGKLNTKNTQTLLMKDTEGLFSFAVVRGKLDGYECRAFAKEYGMTDCYMLDSGGSSQMLTKNDEGYITGRYLPNVLVFKELPKSEEVIEETKQEDNIEPIIPIGKITVQRIGLNIRNHLIFDKRKPIGNKVGFIAKGESVEIVDFIPKLQPDCYQWCKVKWGNGIAYAQYDSSCYTVEIYKGE